MTNEPKSEPKSEMITLALQAVRGLLVEEIQAAKAIAIKSAEKLIRAEIRERVKNENVKHVFVSGGKEVTVAPGRHKSFAKLLWALSLGLNPYLMGLAGGGKTTAAMHAAQDLGLAFYAFSFSSQTTPSQLLGFRNAVGDYISTAFRQAYEFGGVFCADEIDAANSNSLAVLNMGLSCEIMAFPDAMVRRHPDFRVVACANTAGLGSAEYSARNVLDRATLDRFVFIEWSEDRTFYEPLNQNWVFTLDLLRGEIAKSGGLDVFIGPRAYIQGSALVESGMSIPEAIGMTVMKTDDLDVRQRIESLLAKITTPQKEEEEE